MTRLSSLGESPGGPLCGLQSLPADILLAVLAEPFLGLKGTCILSMVNARLWNFFCEYRINTIAKMSKDDNFLLSSVDINAIYIKAFLTRLRFVTSMRNRRTGTSCHVSDIFRVVAEIEKISATMPEPARLAIRDHCPAISSRDIFAAGTIADHVITCMSTLR